MKRSCRRIKELLAIKTIQLFMQHVLNIFITTKKLNCRATFLEFFCLFLFLVLWQGEIPFNPDNSCTKVCRRGQMCRFRNVSPNYVSPNHFLIVFQWHKSKHGAGVFWRFDSKNVRTKGPKGLKNAWNLRSSQQMIDLGVSHQTSARWVFCLGHNMQKKPV